MALCNKPANKKPNLLWQIPPKLFKSFLKENYIKLELTLKIPLLFLSLNGSQEKQAIIELT